MKAWSLLLVVFLVAIQTTGAFSSTPPMQPVVFRGGFSSILGGYAVTGLSFALRPGVLLILGTTFTERLGLEPLLSLQSTTSLGSGWSVSLAASRGDFGGDYRVDQLPEVTLTYGRAIPGTFLHLGLEAGVGHFAVYPTGANGVRGTVAASLGTSAIRLSPVLSLNLSTGYRQYVYSDGALHGAWWGSIQLSATPLPAFSATITYARQDVTGASPLLFDAMSNGHSAAGATAIRLGPAVTLQHSQTYDLIARTISARVYSATLSLERNQTAGLSWDDVARKVSLSYSRPALGSVVVSWEIPTQRISFSFSR